MILSTGLAQDEATGAYDLNGDGLPDRVAAGVVLSVPADATTLRFTTQYLVSDPAEEPRPEARIKYRYAPVDIASPTDFMILETEIERLGDGKVQTPVSHAIDVTGVSQIKLQLQVEEQGPSGTGTDSAVVLSKMYFSDVPVPGHLSPEPGSPECATLGSDPTGPEQDRNGDCRVDYVANPRPTDVSASAGPFRYQIRLFDVPGKIIPFQLSLSYDSERTREEQLGPKWSHSYASTLVSTGDVDPVDSCDDTLIAYTGGGVVEVFEGQPNPDFPATSGIRCFFPSRYPGVFSSMDTVPAPLPDGRLLLRYRYKDGFTAGYEQVTLGSNEYRRRSYLHPDANRNLLWNYDDATGEIESIQDSRGELFYFSYDESFDPPRLTSVNGSGAQVSFGYSALGFLESVTDANGLETTIVDARARDRAAEGDMAGIVDIQQHGRRGVELTVMHAAAVPVLLEDDLALGVHEELVALPEGDALVEAGARQVVALARDEHQIARRPRPDAAVVVVADARAAQPAFEDDLAAVVEAEPDEPAVENTAVRARRLLARQGDR